MDPGENGHGHKVATLTLTLHMDRLTLEVSADVPNIDTALDMLGRATREFEGRLRFNQAQAHMAQAAENVRLAQITNDMRRGAKQ